MLSRTCYCGAEFEPSLNSRGLPTTQRLCESCRSVDSRARDMRLRAGIPPDAPRCSACGCLTSPELGGAHPSPEAGVCMPCYEWASRARARTRISQQQKIPLYRPPYWAGGLDAILERHAVDWGLLMTGTRRAAVVAARAEVAAWLRSLGHSVTAIGRYLHRERTTVLYLLDTYDLAHGRPATHAPSKGSRRSAGAALILGAM